MIVCLQYLVIFQWLSVGLSYGCLIRFMKNGLKKLLLSQKSRLINLQTGFVRIVRKSIHLDLLSVGIVRVLRRFKILRLEDQILKNPLKVGGGCLLNIMTNKKEFHITISSSDKTALDWLAEASGFSRQKIKQYMQQGLCLARTSTETRFHSAYTSC